MYVLKFLLLFSLSPVLLSCEKCIEKNKIEHSKTIDVRCAKLKREAREKGQKAGVCYVGPGTVGQFDFDAKHPDPEACQALTMEAQKKCDALPDDPASIEQVSGPTRVYKNGKLVMIDGRPVCDPD